jgi:hypothetical protein
MRKARTIRNFICLESFEDLFMKARSLFIALLLPAIATAIHLAEAPGQSGRGSANSDRGQGPTITSPATPTKAPDEDGFIRRWLVLEPIAANGLTDSAVQAIVKKEYFADQFTGIPHDGERVKVDGAELTWHALDTRLYNLNLYHFASALGKPTSNVLFWAVTAIDCPTEIKDVRLAIGSNAASVWWVNGKEVIGIYGDRQSVIDDGVSKRLTLRKGQNVVRCAVVNGGGATDFCARFLDKDDVPVKSFVINLDLPADATQEDR